MDDDHVRAEELLPAGDLLVDRRAVVDDELEVEVGDPDARVALARGRLADVPASPAEAEVAALDGVEEHRAVDPLGGHVREGGVALELGQPEVRPERADDGADEVREDVLRVVQLDVGEVAGIPGDVGDQEAGRLRAREHGSSSESGPRRFVTIRLRRAALGCGQVWRLSKHDRRVTGATPTRQRLQHLHPGPDDLLVGDHGVAAPADHAGRTGPPDPVRQHGLRDLPHRLWVTT